MLGVRKGGFKMSEENFFPDIITKLPKADVPIEGVEAYLFQGKDQQILFMSFKKMQKFQNIHTKHNGVLFWMAKSN